MKIEYYFPPHKIVGEPHWDCKWVFDNKRKMLHKPKNCQINLGIPKNSLRILNKHFTGSKNTVRLWISLKCPRKFQIIVKETFRSSRRIEQICKEIFGNIWKRLKNDQHIFLTYSKEFSKFPNKAQRNPYNVRSVSYKVKQTFRMSKKPSHLDISFEISSTLSRTCQWNFQISRRIGRGCKPFFRNLQKSSKHLQIIF